MLFVCKESTLPSKEGEPKRHRPQKAVHMNIWQSLFLSQTGNRPQSSLAMAHSPIPHDLVTVANFADTLDALPLELTRGFSDLRELDAVLSCSCFFFLPLLPWPPPHLIKLESTHNRLSPSSTASLIHLTESIKALTAILLDPTATPAERLAILREVAVFAQRFKLGGEDKIRVVGGVCEGVSTPFLQSHTSR